jgi:hypothetical protein
MFESFYSGQTETGANGEANLPAIGKAPGTGETPDRYGDVPLGVESAWPAGHERGAS